MKRRILFGLILVIVFLGADFLYFHRLFKFNIISDCMGLRFVELHPAKDIASAAQELVDLVSENRMNFRDCAVRNYVEDDSAHSSFANKLQQYGFTSYRVEYDCGGETLENYYLWKDGSVWSGGVAMQRCDVNMARETMVRLSGDGKSTKDKAQLGARIYHQLEMYNKINLLDKLNDYYPKLREACNEPEGITRCCGASVGEMARKEARIMPIGGCKDGYISKKLDCKESLIWCEPLH